MADKPSILFVCVHNAGRSQMAAALLSHLAGDRIEVRSAGTEPAASINPAALTAMAEIGIDLASAAHFPGVSYRDWTLPDPAAQPPATVRSIRDEIAQRVRELISELLASETASG
jgi:arsenate reductase